MSEEIQNEEFTIKDVQSLVDESKTLLKNLYGKDNTKRTMTQDDLRNDVASFVSSQLQNLEHQNMLKGLLEVEIAKRILTHDLSNDELRQYYATVSSEKAKNIDSLFKLFVPTQTTPNTILTPATKENETNVVDLSESQRQAIEKLSRVVSVISAKKDE